MKMQRKILEDWNLTPILSNTTQHIIFFIQEEGEMRRKTLPPSGKANF